MAYEKRIDGRRFDELRPIKAKVGVIKNADGSAMFQIGDTIAYAAIYGPRQLYPRFLKNPKEGLLRCNYNMLPFAGSGERIRPGGSRRSREISLVTERALTPVLDLKEFPNAVVDVYIELPQTDAGTRCAGICAASMALADAGFTMKDLVSAVAVGSIDGTLVVDLCYAEEAYPGEVADIPIAILPRTGKFTLLQMDGIVSKEQLMAALRLAKRACQKIYQLQKAALKERFKVS